jgi:MSHA biogenesis protein MshQ
MSLVRTILLTLAALIAATSAHAQIAFRAAASAGTSGVATTITHVGAGAAATADANSCPNVVSPPMPNGLAGDVLVVVVNSREDNATVNITAGTGWTRPFFRIMEGGGRDVQAYIYYKVATGTNTAADPLTLTQTGTCNSITARASRFRGVDTAQPLETSPIPAGNYLEQNANTLGTGTQVTSVNGSMLLVAGYINDDRNVTEGAGWSESHDIALNIRRDLGLSLHYMLQATAGPASVSGWALGGGERTIGVIFALRPAAQGLTIARPAGTVAGDVMIASIAVRPSSVIITPPAGWAAQAAALQNAAGNSSRQQIFYRVAGGAEPASYTWLFDSAHTGAAGGVVSFSGVDTAAPFDAYAGNLTPQGGDSNLQHRALAVTTTVADTMVISTHSFTSAMPWTPPAGMSGRVDVASIATPDAVGIALGMNTVLQPAAGTTGDKVATVTGNGDTGSATLMALRPFVPSPVLHFTMDQLLWTGAANEVVDASGNGLHGRAFLGANTAFLTPAIAGSPGTCRYGVFDGVDDYVETASNALLNVTDELTVLAWIRPTALPTGGNLKSIISKDNNYEFHLDSAGRIYWWWGGGALELRTTGSVPLNAWTHVAIVYSRAGAFQRVYFNGVQDPTTNNQNAALPTNAMPFQVGSDQGFAGRQFAGLIDEVYVFRSALSQSRVQQYMNTTRACASAINHFSFGHAGSGVGCVDQPITLTAHDATHNPVDANALMVNLSTSNLQGTWTGIQAGGGVLNDPVAGDGAATYTFAVGSNSVTLLFRYADLGAPTETFNFNVSGGGFTESTGTGNASDDPPFTMAQAGFRFRNVEDANEIIPLQLSGKPSNTGFNARTLRLQAINTNTSNGSCTSLFANQTQTVELGGECNNPASCTAPVDSQRVSVNGTPLPTRNNNAGPGAAAYTGVSLNFNASSEADIVVAYPDAGEISLHARFDLNPLVAGFEMIGSSNNFIERPFGLAFPGVNHSSTAAGSLIAAAGDNFAMTVQGYRWAAGEDANDDGVPDGGVNITNNGTVPNFAATATVGVSANLPGVAPGAVSRGAGCANPATVALTGGAGTAADWCYSEVGNALLTASVPNYLAAGVNISGNSGLDGVAGGGYVGRFRPKHFVVTGTPTLANRAALACASTFTYMSEGLRLGFSLEARNTQNALTRNYTGAYARLNLGALANLGLGARSGATNLTPRVDNAIAPTGSFTDGVANLAATTAIRRATPDNPDGPFVATQFGIAPSDADGVLMQAYNQDVDGVGGNDHFAIAPTTALRYGRLDLQNAYGPVGQALAIPIEVQYWNGGAFVANTLDNCTALARANIALSFTGALNACETAVQQASVAFASGAATLTLSAPGAGNTGTVLLTPQLGTAAGTYCPASPGAAVAATASPAVYLLGRWNDAADPDSNANTSYDDKPSGQAGFGLYGSQPKSFIFFRENY